MMPSALFTADMADSAKLHIEEARADMTGQRDRWQQQPRPSPPQIADQRDAGRAADNGGDSGRTLVWRPTTAGPSFTSKEDRR